MNTVENVFCDLENVVIRLFQGNENLVVPYPFFLMVWSFGKFQIDFARVIHMQVPFNHLSRTKHTPVKTFYFCISSEVFILHIHTLERQLLVRTIDSTCQASVSYWMRWLSKKTNEGVHETHKFEFHDLLKVMSPFLTFCFITIVPSFSLISFFYHNNAILPDF